MPRHRRRTAVALAILTIAAASTVGPGSRAAAQQADTTPRVDEARVRAALRSPEALWAFVTAPETRWVDRMAAAWRAFPAGQRQDLSGIRTDYYGTAPAPPRFVFPMEWFPRVVAARRELAREAAIHRWGFRPRVPPGSRMGSLGVIRPFPGEQRRVVLGRVWMLPDWFMEGSEQPEEVRYDPWPAQVQSALDVLYKGFEDTTRVAEFFAAALRLPCASADDAESLVYETRTYASAARAVTPEVVGAWRNAALNPAWPRLLGYVDLGFYAIGISRDEQAFWLGQALMADLAAAAPDEEVPMLALHAGWLDSDERPGWEIRRPGTPDVAVLALAERVDRLPPSLAPYIRAGAGKDVLEVADSAAAAALPTAMQTDSVGNEQAFAAFRAWFAAHRATLAARAARQAPRVNAARAAMARTPVCAGTTTAAAPAGASPPALAPRP